MGAAERAADAVWPIDRERSCGAECIDRASIGVAHMVFFHALLNHKKKPSQPALMRASTLSVDYQPPVLCSQHRASGIGLEHQPFEQVVGDGAFFLR